MTMPLTSSRPPIESAPRLFVAADLAVLPVDLPSGTVDYELDNGRLLTMVPPGNSHGSIQARIVTELVVQGERQGHGKAWSEVGIILWRNPDRVVGADAAFVSKASLPVREAPEGYLETLPELVVEIRSKNDTAAYVERKVQDYLTAGVKTIVVIDPTSRTAHVFRSNGDRASFQDTEALDIQDTIPGFQLVVGQLFDA